MSANILDKAADVIETVFNNAPTPNDGNIQDCVYEQGYANGVSLATTDLVAGTVGTDHSAGREDAYNQAYHACEVGQYFDQGTTITIPSLTNPIAAGLEIALTPTSLNAGEDKVLESPSIFEKGYYEGYHQTALAAFDQKLDERLEINWGHSDAAVAPSIFDVPHDSLEGSGSIGGSAPIVDSPSSSSDSSSGSSSISDSGSPSSGSSD